MTTRGARTVWHRLVQAAALATAAFSLLTLLDEQHRLLELFSHFRVQYLAAAVILALLFAALRKPAGLMLMLALSGLNAAQVLPWYLGEAEHPETAVLKVLHANVQASNTDAAIIGEVIAREQPDVVFLQEITDRWLEDLEPISATYPFRLAVPRADKFGIVAYSRIPPLSSRSIASPPNGYPTLLLRVSAGGRPLTLVSSHPPPPLGPSGHRHRNEQLESLAALMAPIAESKVLIGDLNITMWSHNYASLKRAGGLVDARRGRGVMPTWPVGLPIASIPIDHCLVSPDIAVVDLVTGPDIGSDHRPLIARLGFQKPGPSHREIAAALPR